MELRRESDRTPEDAAETLDAPAAQKKAAV
jgi:hypothetical protein